jgi:hydrogenase maturation protein HypF
LKRASMAEAGARIEIQGIVQGVGFRPFVYGLAQRFGLKGWVRNTAAGVEMEIEGSPFALETFLQALRSEAPPLASIDEVTYQERQPNGYTGFEIVHSEDLPGAFQPVSSDVALCPDCLRELLDPSDRRYRYPFINCTNCGPRFTIIKDVPYDRPATTMAPFEMCPHCAAEYHDPQDRRFHAQPVACPACGPHIWLEAAGAICNEREAALQDSRRRLASGEILAVKGLGGFHLACDAANEQAVLELRRRKLRVDKPFAVMMPDLEAVERHCFVTPAARRELLSRQRPIVILERRPDSPIAAAVAPGQHSLGVMLPYTPLHVLLLERQSGFPDALVMTSGNLSEEPIASSNEDARRRLGSLADAFLLNNRDIHIRCDDSVIRLAEDRAYPVRRSRGFAPRPIHLNWQAPPLLAAGAELKNTFCLTRGHYAFLSHHIGDLENYETLQAFESGIAHFERLFRIRPEAVGYDLHPDYLATRYALQRAESESLPAIGVQHHHAHIASAMCEHGLNGERPVIGVAFDGTGYGDDGAIWGGEILIADYVGYQRPLHLAYSRMPGGETAVRNIWRLALALLDQAGLPWDEDLPAVRAASESERRIVRRQLDLGLNSPQTSSMGRLFDAVAALSGLRQSVNYEAQAAIELEASVAPSESQAYPFDIDGAIFDPSPMVHALVRDIRSQMTIAQMAARFHNGLVELVLQACQQFRSTYGLQVVALSGGVWQNLVLLERVAARLRQADFEVLLHRQVPANDGGLALGQAAVACRRIADGLMA